MDWFDGQFSSEHMIPRQCKSTYTHTAHLRLCLCVCLHIHIPTHRALHTQNLKCYSIVEVGYNIHWILSMKTAITFLCENKFKALIWTIKHLFHTREDLLLPPTLSEEYQKWKLSKERHIENASGFDRGLGQPREGVEESSRIRVKCLGLLLLQNFKCFLVPLVPGLSSLFFSGPPQKSETLIWSL